MCVTFSQKCFPTKSNQKKVFMCGKIFQVFLNQNPCISKVDSQVSDPMHKQSGRASDHIHKQSGQA